MQGPPILVTVTRDFRLFLDALRQGFNGLVENDYDDGGEGFEHVQLAQVNQMENNQVTQQYMRTMFRQAVVQSKHQPTNILEGYCIQKFKAQHTFSCLQESLAIIYFYKYVLQNDIEQLVYESIQKWKTRVYEMIYSFDNELLQSLQTECPYTVVPLFNNWLEKQGYDKFIGVYQYVMIERDDFDRENVDNYLIVYRQHVYPVNAAALKIVEVEQLKILEKKKKIVQRGLNRIPEAYQMKSTIRQYYHDIQTGQYSKYQNRSQNETREISHQRVLKLCLRGPQETEGEFILRQMEWIAKRYQKFDNFCELGVDSETYTDNVDTGLLGHGNQVPYLVCFAGRIQQQQESGNIIIHNYEIDTNQSREEILAQAKAQSFWGTNCWEEFVKWIKRNRYYQTGYIGQRKMEIGGEDETKSKKYIKNNSQNILRLQNFIVAHNGGKFDYGYLFSYLSQYIGIVDIIGTQSQIKGLHCNNIYFYDTSLIHVGSLKDQCKAFLKEKDWKRDIQNVVVDVKEYQHMSEDRKNELIYYCLFDAHSVHKLHQAQFRDIYSRPFGHGFMQNKQNKGPFVHSSAQLAVNIFQNQFLEVDIKAHPRVYLMERLSMRGGHTQVYLPQMTLGVCIDIKSSYPAAMYNQMPWEPLQKDMIVFNGGIDVWECQFENYDLLAINSFEFPKDILYPTCAIKVFQDGDLNGLYDIICPTSYQEKNSVLFLWGVEVKLARDNGAKITVGGKLPYKPFPIFKNYIKKIFGIRQAWGEDGQIIKYFSGDVLLNNISPIAREEVVLFYRELFGDNQLPAMLVGFKERYPDYWDRLQSYRKIQDKTCKLLMNSLFGKTGQRSYDKYMCGIVEDIYEAAYEVAVFQQDKVEGDIKLQPVADYNVPLMQMTYRERNQDVNQVGSLVRLASYITAIARCNLISKMELIRGVLGDHRIVYCDTDSIFVQFKTWGDMERYGIEQRHLLKQLQKSDGIKETMEYVQENLKKLIRTHPDYLKLMDLKVQDIRHVDDKSRTIEFIKMDEEVLGTFQLEKYILEAQFIASKAYCGYMMQNGLINEVIKVKGVKIIDLKNASYSQANNPLFQEKKEVIKLFRQAHESIFSGDFDKCGFIVNSMNNFQRIGTMTSVHVRQKICCHSLIKRRYEYLGEDSECYPIFWRSFPHDNVDEFFKVKILTNEKKKILKDIIMGQNLEKVEQYEQDPATMQIRQAVLTNSINQKVTHVRKNIFPSLFNDEFHNFPEAIKQLYIRQDQTLYNFIRERFEQNKQKITETEYKRSRLIHKMVRMEYIDHFHIHLVAACKTLFDYAQCINYEDIKYLNSLSTLITDYVAYPFDDVSAKIALKLRSLEHIFAECQVLMCHMLQDFDKSLLMIVDEISGKVEKHSVSERVTQKFQGKINRCKLIQEFEPFITKEMLMKMSAQIQRGNRVGKIEQIVCKFLLENVTPVMKARLFGTMKEYSTKLPSGTKKLIKYIKNLMGKLTMQDKLMAKVNRLQELRDETANQLKIFFGILDPQVIQIVEDKLQNLDKVIGGDIGSILEEHDEDEINEISANLKGLINLIKNSPIGSAVQSGEDVINQE